MGDCDSGFDKESADKDISERYTLKQVFSFQEKDQTKNNTFMFSSENETKRMILANNCLGFHEYTTFDHSSGFTELSIFLSHKPD